MVLDILKRLGDLLRISNSVRKRNLLLNRSAGMECGGEFLEERRFLSATTISVPAEVSLTTDTSPVVARKATQQTIDSPYGPIELTIRGNGTRFRGTAVIALTPGPDVPNVKVSPIRFNARLKNFQLEGRFSGTFALQVLNAPTQRFKGTFTARPELLNPTNVAGHVTVKVEKQTVADQDFNVPLATLLALLQQQG